jgi:hypothetical protein
MLKSAVASYQFVMTDAAANNSLAKSDKPPDGDDAT